MKDSDNKIKYGVIVGYADSLIQTSRLKKKLTYPELIIYLVEGFSNGVFRVKLYKDFRQKDKYLEVKRDDFSEEQLEKYYLELQKKRRLEVLKKNKIVYEDTISINKQYLNKVIEEINQLNG